MQQHCMVCWLLIRPPWLLWLFLTNYSSQIAHCNTTGQWQHSLGFPCHRLVAPAAQLRPKNLVRSCTSVQRMEACRAAMWRLQLGG
jgi:hypothetical protein